RRIEYQLPGTIGNKLSEERVKWNSRDCYCARLPRAARLLKSSNEAPTTGGYMNRTVRILAAISLLLVATAFVLGRVGMNAGKAFVPVAYPTDVMFGEEPGGVWIGIAMVLLLVGLATTVAAIKCWIQNRNDLKGFSRHATDIAPKG